MLNRKKLTILIPCRNEEKGIAKVIKHIPTSVLGRLGFDTEIIVIDNNSDDNTVQIVKNTDAKIIHERNPGKGNAIRAGFKALSPDTDFVVMLDGDSTYKSNEIVRMLEPLINNFCDVIVGSRLGGKINKQSLKFSNRLVNWGFTFLVRVFYQANVTDVLSGYFAWKKGVIDKLVPHLDAEGFEIEMEMITKMKKLGFSMYSVPITYNIREGESKIAAFNDGVRILKMFFRNLKWDPKKANKKPSDWQVSPKLKYD